MTGIDKAAACFIRLKWGENELTVIIDSCCLWNWIRMTFFDDRSSRITRPRPSTNISHHGTWGMLSWFLDSYAGACSQISGRFSQRIPQRIAEKKYGVANIFRSQYIEKTLTIRRCATVVNEKTSNIVFASEINIFSQATIISRDQHSTLCISRRWGVEALESRPVSKNAQSRNREGSSDW